MLATVVAWFAGAVPNYLLNRYWAWRHRSRPDAGRELVPYAIIVVATTAAAALVTTLADTLVHEWVTSHTWQTLFVGAAYLGTYGIMFLLKFVLFDRLVFSGGRSRSARSRSTASGTAA